MKANRIWVFQQVYAALRDAVEGEALRKASGGGNHYFKDICVEDSQEDEEAIVIELDNGQQFTIRSEDLVES
jgi:hypothetical protein